MAAKRSRPKKKSTILLPLASKINKFLGHIFSLVGKPFFLFGIKVLALVVFVSKLKIKLPKTRLPKHGTIFKRFRIPKKVFFLFIISVSLIIIFIFWSIIIRGLPSPFQLVTRNQRLSTKIYDRNGVLLYKIFKNENRTLVPLSQIPLNVRQAVVAIEDSDFYLHPGFSAKGIIRAIIRNAAKGELSGGSTITQQLVKNALLTREKTISRKLKEMLLAIEVEFTFSKDQILEMYLNEVSFGGTAYGIEEASQTYFGKNAKDLSLSEGALLAGLPKSPTRFSPFGANPDLAIKRQHEVLEAMVTNRFITPKGAEAAKKESLNFKHSRFDIKAPHFVMYVREKLVEKYGEEMLEEGGLEVVTTLDYKIQEIAESIVKKEIDSLAKLRVGNGAAVVLNPKTGEILAMVGSKDYFDLSSDGNVNVTTRPRQPGSAIKVINYAYALSNGFTPATSVEDSPVTFSLPGLPPYSPKNYDGGYRGTITIRSALAQSRNIPAVKILASYPVIKMIELARKMGITTWIDPSNYGLSLTLGGGEVKLIDLAQVYATIANFGKRPEVSYIKKVVNYKGEVLESSKCNLDNCPHEQVVDPRVAFLLIDILKDNEARSPSFGSFSQLVISDHPEVVVKTGTSNDLRDNLTIGFNQGYLVAVWVGNNDNSPMARIASGVTGAAPIWNKILRALIANSTSNSWEVPKGLIQIPCPYKPEWFLQEKVSKKECLKPLPTLQIEVPRLPPRP
ncbi:MAG: PBP1A family penicillin-binding protein [Patescibacteria group bacterium]